MSDRIRTYQPARGTYTGNTAAQDISLGFRPVYIKVYNETDGTEYFEVIDGLTAGSAYVSKDHASAQFTVEATNYITISDKGFTIGTEMSETGKVYRYIAF